MREGLGIVAYSSLAGEFLSGAVRSGRVPPGQAPPGQVPRGPRAAHLAQYRTAAGGALLAELERIAAARGRPVAAVAVAWVLAQPGVTARWSAGLRDAARCGRPRRHTGSDDDRAAALTKLVLGPAPEFVDW